MREPPFWWRPPGISSRLLAPLGAVYGAAAARRLVVAGARVAAPVICIGNPTVGGAGKTPVAITVAAMLKAAGERPAFLTRGYGGREGGPLRVDAERHRATEVGDESLLLARVAPTIVAHDRVRGAQAALAAGASVIVMDDGFQNPSLRKDVAVLVIDAARGLGNAQVLPAGPLRAPLPAQLACAHAVVVVGRGTAAAQIAAAARARDIAVFAAHLVPDPKAVAAVKGNRILAFAGIGDPAKFFATLRASGLALAETRSFADHHRYSLREAKKLREAADRRGLLLMTTEKDLARLRGEPAGSELVRAVHTLPVALVFDDEVSFRTFLFGRLSAARTL
ncbi:MAG TPA: tetraacyldisaccharide 4'-kinase [Xanthobacteraceae bacterium]|jgi:tetraacyldisaccharide 4'-kinase